MGASGGGKVIVFRTSRRQGAAEIVTCQVVDVHKMCTRLLPSAPIATTH